VLSLQVKDMAAKTEVTVSVENLVDELKKLLAAPTAAAAAAVPVAASSEASS